MRRLAAAFLADLPLAVETEPVLTVGRLYLYRRGELARVCHGR